MTHSPDQHGGSVSADRDTSERPSSPAAEALAAMLSGRQRPSAAVSGERAGDTGERVAEAIRATMADAWRDVFNADVLARKLAEALRQRVDDRLADSYPLDYDADLARDDFDQLISAQESASAAFSAACHEQTGRAARRLADMASTTPDGEAWDFAAPSSPWARVAVTRRDIIPHVDTRSYARQIAEMAAEQR